MPINEIPHDRKVCDSTFVENRGPSMVMNEPPLWTVAPVSRVAFSNCAERSGQNGSATLTWTTSPSPKKVRTRSLVLSNN